MEFTGCKYLSEVARVPCEGMLPEEFFKSFISTRTPVVLIGFPTDSEWKVNKDTWSAKNLKEKTPPDMEVRVEYRDNEDESFGKGREKQVTFHKFLDEVESGSNNLYMTTQELEYDLEDQPEIISAPLTALFQDFPMSPSLFSTLVTSNINLWYGRSQQWTTSGLHHDYHDNLYIMVIGQKQITLISPAFAHHLYTVGKIATIHPNGRINYEGQPTFADGRSPEADRAWTASQNLKMASTLPDEEAGSENDDDEDDANGNDSEEEEDDIDRALEEVLNAEHGSDMDDWEDDDFEEDGDEDVEQSDDDNASEEEISNDTSVDISSKKRKYHASNDPNDIVADVSQSDSPAKRVRLPKKSSSESTRPENFSQIDTNRPLADLTTDFPLYSEAMKHAVTVVLKEGEMLYIPCGWFHEVRSQGSEGHMAFNYWFHPPDKLDRYEQPYSSSFWPSVFASKMKR